MGDVLTVAWKEWRELLQLGGSHRGGRFSLVILVGVFGVLLPLQSGAEWVQSPAPVFYWGWVPLMLVGSAVADSFVSNGPLLRCRANGQVARPRLQEPRLAANPARRAA